MRKKIGSAAIFIVTIMLFGMFFSKTNLFVYAAESQLVINTTVDKSNVNTGDIFTYTLKYANPSTTQDSNNVVVTDILPDNVQYVSFQSSADVKSVSQEGNAITFTFKSVLKAGSTGYIKVAAKFPEGTTLNGTTADNAPTIKDDNGIINSNTVTVTAKTLAIPDWNIAKTLVNATTPALDQPITYKVQVNGNSVSGGLNLKNIRVSDTIPFGATFISATNEGNYNSGEVIWPTFDLKVGQSKSFYVTITYPSEAFTTNSSTVTNNVTAIANDINSTDVTKTAYVQHGLADPTYGTGDFTKSSRQSNDEYSAGDTAYFYLSNILNTGNVPLNKFIITDDIPSDINLTEITTGQYNSGCSVKITYATTGAAVSVTTGAAVSVTTGAAVWIDTQSPTNNKLRVADLHLAAGEYITKVTWEISNGVSGLPVGFMATSPISVNGKISDVSSNTVITNNAVLTAQLGDSPDLVNDIVKHASNSITVIDSLPWPVATKSIINGNSTVNMGDTVTYDVRIKNHEFATGDFINPVALDVLPSDLESYVLVEYKKTDVLSTTTTPSAVTFQQSGQDLKWSFDETLKPGEYIDIIYKAHVKDNALVGSKINKLYVGSASQTTFQDKANGINDNVGLGCSKMVTAYVDTFVRFAGSITAKKLVKGQLDDKWNYYGDKINGTQYYGETLPGGIADYQLQVSNNQSNGAISNIVVIDQLPSKGDIGVIDTSSRGSEWTPYLVNKIICVDKISGATKDFPLGTKIYYSTVAHPSKVELSNSKTNGSANPGAGDDWSETPPADITTVKSLKFDFGSYKLAANDNITLQWPMRAPAGAPTNKIAWNSFGYGATYPDAPVDSNPDVPVDSSFLPSEPIKVGFEIHDPTATYKIGNYVWEDMNKNGLQDDGDDSGINGILVNLYTETTTGSAVYTNKVSYTRTGFDQDGKPGYYLFPNLQPGNYKVEFVYPTYYKVTDLNVGNDSTKNSKIDPLNKANYNIPGDLDNGKYYIKTDPITITNSDNLDQDAGLYRVATLGDYVWDDANLDSVEDISEKGISGITVDLLDINNNTVKDADGNTIGQATTDPTGKYSFTNLMPGSYHVKFTDPLGNFVFSNQGVADGTHSVPDKDTGVANVTLQSNKTNNTIDAGLHLAQIGDFVWHDKNADGIQNDATSGNSGISGVKVDLVNSSGSQITDHYGKLATTTTDLNGKYLFDSLNPGTYYVKFTMPSGYTKVSPKNATDSTIDSNIDTQTTTGAAVTLIAGQTNKTIDAGFYNLASIGDKVWNDLNGNGIQDTTYNNTTEPGLAGVTVKLLDGNGNPVLTDGNGNSITDQHTNANGLYSFSNLNPGKYMVEFENPDATNYIFSLKNVGSDTAKDSNADPTTGLTEARTLTSGANDTSIDAGLHKGVIGNFVWTDTNGNGVQDASETGTGISNVTVNLYDGSNILLKTTVTNSSGYYEFDDLNGGNYQVEFKLPTDYVFTEPNQGGDTAKNSDADVITGKTPIFTLAAGTVDTKWDAGMYKPVNIGDYVWVDMNRDGKQDSTDIVLPGTTVELYKSSDLSNVFLSKITDASGKYSFTNLLPGNYRLKFTQPDYYYYYIPTTIGINATDSKIDALGQINISLSSGVDNYTFDAGYLPPTAAIKLDKTVYQGHDNGGKYLTDTTKTITAMPSTPLTYVFKITNTGSTYLSNINLNDTTLNKTQSNMHLITGTLPVALAPEQSIYYYFDSELTTNLTNIATVTGTPSNEQGAVIPNTANVTNTNSASVALKVLNPNIKIEKKVYAGNNGGASHSSATESLTGKANDPITYVFTVTNTGDCNLKDISIDDITLGLDKSKLTKISGDDALLLPNASVIYYYETTIKDNLINTAKTTGKPVYENGLTYSVASVTDTSSATVTETAPAIDLQKTVYLGWDNGNNYNNGVESVFGVLGQKITYVFKVTNTGGTNLNNIALDDAVLGINTANMILKSGNLNKLTPGNTLYYYYETTITNSLVNTAHVVGTPVDSKNVPLNVATLPENTDTATVVIRYNGGGGKAATVTTSTGTVKVEKPGEVNQTIETKVTTEADGIKIVSVKAQDAIFFKEPEGTKSSLSDMDKLGFSSTENSNVVISDGNIKIQNLKNGTEEKINVTFDLGNGQKIIIGTIDVKVSDSGDVSFISKLIDPYGIVTDAATGKIISGANLTIYYANTDRNKASGKIPDTVVQLPGIDGFKPNNNENPQVSDASGTYGFLVFPTSDYYIVVTKEGYNKYTSPTISVEQEIVKFDIKMNNDKIIENGVNNNSQNMNLIDNETVKKNSEANTDIKADKHLTNSKLPATATNNYNILLAGILLFLASLSLLLLTSKKHRN